MQLLHAVKVKLDKCNETDSSDKLVSLLNDLMAKMAHLPDEFRPMSHSMTATGSSANILSSMMLFLTYVSSCMLEVVSGTFD